MMCMHKVMVIVVVALVVYGTAPTMSKPKKGNKTKTTKATPASRGAGSKKVNGRGQQKNVAEMLKLDQNFRNNVVVRLETLLTALHKYGCPALEKALKGQKNEIQMRIQEYSLIWDKLKNLATGTQFTDPVGDLAEGIHNSIAILNFSLDQTPLCRFSNDTCGQSSSVDERRDMYKYYACAMRDFLLAPPLNFSLTEKYTCPQINPTLKYTCGKRKANAEKKKSKPKTKQEKTKRKKSGGKKVPKINKETKQ